VEEQRTMKKDWKYILYISLAFGLFVIVKLLSPKQYDWSMTFAHDDKNPYGAYALNELLPGLFAGKKISHSYKTLYEIKDSLTTAENIIIISSNFSADNEDTNMLLEHVENGGSVFISAQYFWGHFSDTLGLSTYDYFFKSGHIFDKRDTSFLKFANAHLDTVQEFPYRRDNIHNYFNQFDATRTTVIAKNDYNYPVTVRMKIGKGELILNSTPLIFSNIYLLSSNNHAFVSKTLSCLPLENVTWTEYYHLGRMEAATPLRFILTNEALRWAYYITIISLLLFMLFEMKRRQRIIPIIKPLGNTTLEFVNTIGNLYYQSGDHKNIAEKKIHFFMDQLRSTYWLNTTHLDDSFIKTLANKAGKNDEDARILINIINSIRSKEKISAEELLRLNHWIDKFQTAHH
jgi:hypothetical protein